MEQSITQPYRGKNRLLILFAPSESDERLTRQIDGLMAEEDGLRERDVFIFIVAGQGAVKAIGDGASGARLDPDDMRERFDVARDDFRLVVIDKDGDVQLSEDCPVATFRLFDLIDELPVRR